MPALKELVLKGKYVFKNSVEHLKNHQQAPENSPPKVNSKYSSWADILEGVPQGTILLPLAFNIFLCDLFIIIDITYFASYADDNTLYVIKNTITEVLHKLETVSKKLFMWFAENEMMANVDKCHLLLSSVEDHTIEINGFTVKNLHCEKLLGVHFDDQPKFDFHIEKLCKNANRKYPLHGPVKQMNLNECIL